MKNLILFIFGILLGAAVSAQVPQSFRYQAVARDNSGNILANQSVSFRISILSGSVSGTVAYSETHTGLSTNSFGLVEMEIGKGTPVTGTFSSIEWGNDSYYVRIEMDPEGGTAYQELSTSQLLSVPYALHAKTVETGDNWGNQTVVTNATLAGNGTTGLNLKLAPQGAASGQVLKWNGTTWAPANVLIADEATWNKSGNIIYYNAGNVGIGTSTPTSLLHINGTGSGGGNVLFTGQYKDTPDDPPASGAGTRLMWYPDKAAFRAGYVTSTQWDKDSIGFFSVAMGNTAKAKGDFSTAMGTRTTALGLNSTALGTNTTASGYGSTAMGAFTTASGFNSTALGTNTTASGNYSIAMGINTSASGGYSTAMGILTTASGARSTAMGSGTIASSAGTFAIGQYNVGGGSAISWVEADPLFEIGNGPGSESRRNALTVLKNGNVGIGTSTPNALLNANGTGTGEGNVLFTGAIKEESPGTPPATGAGTRLMWYPDKAAFRAGHVLNSNWDKDSIGNFSVAMGYTTKAKGAYSTAMGTLTTASEAYSTAMGFATTASGSSSTAFGTGTIASGNSSTVMGYHTTAPSFSETVIGSFNTQYTPNSTYGWNVNDRLFVIGNGTGSTARSNAITVLKNGNTGIGADSPTSKLDVMGEINVNNNNIRNVAVPVNAQDAATKAYVDALITQLSKAGAIVADADGNIYPTVRIGSQIWMAENLKTTKYNDGAAIPNVTDGTTWSGLTSGAYCWYNNDAATNKNLYGALYNWNAVKTGKLCPEGWHVPSDAEWTTLTDYLGSPAGGKMKSVTGWESPNTGATNESGFSGLPGGQNTDGIFVNIGGHGYWWSSTEGSATSAWVRRLSYDDEGVSRGNIDKETGFSVRCVRDY